MILALDVGNSNIVVGSIEDGKITTIERIRTEINATSAEYAIKLLDMINYMHLDADGFEGSVISSVVPPVTASLKQAIERVTKTKCMTVTHDMDTGLKIKIDDPSTVGADLIVGGVAAIEYYGAPAIVIDMGTATTVTLIDKNKAFRGGAILPGVKLGLAALASGTSLLPEIYVTPPKKCISTNTVDCLESGAVFGTAAMLDGLIDKMEKEIGYECTLIATGGLASSVTPYCTHKIICDDDLLLKGLWTLYERNKKKVK